MNIELDGLSMFVYDRELYYDVFDLCSRPHLV